ncbi:MAG: TolC family protein [Bryobacteraceae bacterium]
MLRITTQEVAGKITFRLEGKLAGPWVPELEQCWLATAAAPGQGVVLDLAQVDFIDEAGRKLLARMHARGVRLLAKAPWIRAVVEQIAGLIWIALVLTALAPGLRAREAPAPEPLRLTLRDAVETALKQNPQVQIANLNVAQSREEDNVARSALLPQIGLQSFERVQRMNVEALIGRRFPGMAQHSGPFGVFQGGAGASVPVFDLTLWRRWRASQRGVEAVRAQEDAVREQTTALVVSQYLGALRAAADVEASRSRVKLAEALYNQARDLQEAGVGTGVDALRANVQLQAERQRLIGAQTVFDTTVFGLRRLLNLDPAQPLDLADRVSFFETPPPGPDQSLKAALDARPELRALRFREQALQLQTAAARASRLPSLRFEGAWGYQGLDTPAAAIPSYMYTASVTFPLFTGGRIGAETARAQLEVRKTRQQQQDLRNQIAVEVQTATAQLSAARNEVDVATLGVKLATEEVEQARDRFQAGVANNIEVIQAQDALARANDNQIAALYRYNQARADLARATGQIRALYTK